MKITNRKLFRIVFLLSAAILLGEISGKASVPIGEIIGTAWTIGDAVVGTTTLTPAYAIESWDYTFKETGLGPPIDGKIRSLLRRSRTTGEYLYYRHVLRKNYTNQPITTAFILNSVNKLNMTCQTPFGAKVLTTTTLETHTEFVWMASVVTTGFWPDNGPWTVWLKTGGNKTGCNPRPPASLFFWTSASIGRSGG